MTTAATLEEALEHTRETVRRSGTSFAAGMRILSKPRRDAMHAIYAFCREIDDIADDMGEAADKRVQLAAWRAEIDRVYAGEPKFRTGVALARPVRDFDLPKEEFHLLIEGMEMDAGGPIVAPAMETLLAYTRRVAGAVGMLSMPVFGAPRNEAARDFALSLGDALQFTNILRDVTEDARIGRLYLPRELLVRHGAPMTPGAIASSPALAPVARDFAALATERFAQARKAMRALDWRVLRPALLMMGVYEAYLKRMETSGWQTGARVSLSMLDKLVISARYALAPPLDAAP
jgi:squalene synthase HpnD